MKRRSYRFTFVKLDCNGQREKTQSYEIECSDKLEINEQQEVCASIYAEHGIDPKEYSILDITILGNSF